MIRPVTGLLAGLFAALILLSVSACSPSDSKQGPLVLAAASLQDALTEVAGEWHAQGHAMPVLSFAGTSALARQVEAGAPADIFISADEEWMSDLEKKGLIRPDTRVSFLTNRLVLVAPADSKATLTIAPHFPLADALGSKRLAMADYAAVPAGRYAKQALESLGVWDSVKDQVVPAENVRLALALVARKEAGFGVVYATDAKSEPGVRVIGTFPAESHEPISYPVALLASSTNPDAEAFRGFLSSAEASGIFRKYGFEIRSAP